MSISPKSWAKVLQRLMCLKFYDIQKREIRFTLGLNTAKNIDYKKKIFM